MDLAPKGPYLSDLAICKEHFARWRKWPTPKMLRDFRNILKEFDCTDATSVEDALERIQATLDLRYHGLLGEVQPGKTYTAGKVEE